MPRGGGGRGRGGKKRGRGKGRGSGSKHRESKKPPKPAEAASAHSERDRCAKCKNELGEGHYFCGKCGFSVEKNVFEVFEPYWTDEQVEKARTEGSVVIGTLVLTQNKAAYVKSGDLPRDVYLPSTGHVNRAFHGDVVAVKIDPEEEWKKSPRSGVGGASSVSASSESIELSSSRLPEKFNAALSLYGVSETSTAASAAVGDHVDDELWQSKTDFGFEDSEHATTLAALTASNTTKSSGDLSHFKTKGSLGKIYEKFSYLMPTGKVVRIVACNGQSVLSADRSVRSNVMGTLFASTRPVPTHWQRVHVRPLDKKLPNFVLPTAEAPQEWVEADPNVDSKQTHVIVEITPTGWSHESQLPSCSLVRCLGEARDIAPRTEALLQANNVDHDPNFSQEILSSLPNPSEWKISPEELKKRKDFRKLHVCTVDPATARDLDDALHIRKLDSGNYEVGVHIADVTHFVEEGSPLDLEAGRRATTVYLVQKALPMLPAVLSHDLCSLNPHTDKLAYSCVFQLTPEGNLAKNSKTWYGRSVINCKRRLSYEQAQNIVDGKTEDYDAETVWAIRSLHSVAMNRREKRFTTGGALAISSQKLSFKLDESTRNPLEVTTYPMRDTNRMIEEYMLLANFLVAEFLLGTCRQKAFVRGHAQPDKKGMQQVSQRLEQAGFPAMYSFTSKAVHDYIQEVSKSDPKMAVVISELMKQPMQPAKYAVAGMLNKTEWRHWALNIPYYTHFTSPIRRYADVVVHRQLTAILGGAGVDSLPSEEQLAKQAELCNEKNANSKSAQEESDAVYLYTYIRHAHEIKKPFECECAVMELGPNSFTALMLGTGVQKRIHCTKEFGALKVEKVYKENAPKKFKSVGEEISNITELKLFFPNKRTMAVKIFSHFFVRAVPKVRDGTDISPQSFDLKPIFGDGAAEDR